MKQQERRTWAEISLPNLEHNYRALRALLPEGCRFLGVVKADAYGHGAVPVARKLEELGAEYLAVACLAEARELREAGVLTPILLLGFTPTDCAEELLRYGLTQTVYDLESARAFSAAAQAAGRRLRIHVKADTGMSRLGWLCNEGHRTEAADAIAAVCALPGLEAEGIYTHFANADGDEAGNHVPNPPLRRQRCCVKVSLYSSGYGAPRGGPVRPLSRPLLRGVGRRWPAAGNGA